MNCLVSQRRLLRLSLLAVATSLASLTPTAWSDTVSNEQADFKKRLYLGVGLGASTLQPNPREPDIIAVGDDSDIGFHLNLGYDINRWLSAELYLANLGEADIDRIDFGNEQAAFDSIDYLIADVAVLGYLFNSRSGLSWTNTQHGVFCREALSLYGRLGIGVMRNEDENSLIIHGRNHKEHVTVGVGLEYGFRNGIGIRGEWTGFDSDARYVNISLVKRFGDSECQEPTDRKVTGNGTKPPITTGIPPGPDVIPTSIVAPVSHFGFDESIPDANSIEQLSVFADTIRNVPGTLQLTGHTDGSGSDYYNDQLSQRRVRAVQQLLIERGIEAERFISINARGEHEPVDDNNTRTGRARNRRVEIEFMRD